MKTKLLKVSKFLLFALLISQFGFSQTSVTINPNSPWLGYVNVFNTSGGYEFGSAWAPADIKTVVNTTSNTVTLYPNYNTFANAEKGSDADKAYWINGTKGNKYFEGNTFVEDSSLDGQSVIFSGYVESKTLSSDYTVRAFIKALDPNNGYTDVLGLTADLVVGQNFTITTTSPIPNGLIVQYGFRVYGLNGNPADETVNGNVVVGPAKTSSEENSVTVVGAAGWKGYANVFDLSNAYQFGSEWGVADIKSVVSVDNNTVTLYPNYNTYANAQNGSAEDKAYWINGDKGNKYFEGNTFVENSSLAGKKLTFSGYVESNTLDAQYTSKAFIKGLDPNNGYVDVLGLTAALKPGENFEIKTTEPIPAGLIVQYGFQVYGLNGNPVDEAANGNIVVGPTRLAVKDFNDYNFGIYPNPTSDILNISANTVINNVSVYSLLGQEILNIKSNENQVSINISNIANGVYIVKSTINGSIVSKRIIKN
jgi:hypothetical protein